MCPHSSWRPLLCLFVKAISIFILIFVPWYITCLHGVYIYCFVLKTLRIHKEPEIVINIYIHGDGLKTFRPSLRETRDNRPLDRGSNRSWCHTTSMIKLFWSQSMAIGGSIQARWKVLGLAYNQRETQDKLPLSRDPDRSRCHRHTTSMIKLFWLQPMGPWISATYRKGEKFLA